MRKVLAVAWREFRYTALTRAFIIAAVGMPLIVALSLVLLPLVTRSAVQPLVGTLAVFDPTGAVQEALEFEMEPSRFGARVERVIEDLEQSADEAAQLPADTAQGVQSGAAAAAAIGAAMTGFDLDIERLATESDVQDAKERVREGALTALAVFAPSAGGAFNGTADGGRWELFVPPGFVPNHTMLLESLLADAAARARTSAAGLDIDQVRALVRRAPVTTTQLSSDGGEVREQVLAKMLIPGAFMLLLWMAVFVSANYLLTSTIEEKSSKVMEVLLSAVSPLQLMAGKLLGQSMVSAVMLLAYGGVGFTALAALASGDLVPVSHIVYLVLYFLMAYFMIASLMAAIGSAANDVHEAQSLLGPAMLVLLLPLMLWFPISQDPNGMLATITSFVPPLTPFVMILRVTATSEPVPAWQIALSIVIGYAAMAGMVWMAARVFRVGVLAQGKTPTPRELLRWLRTA